MPVSKEMTLDEYVAQLPTSHRARKEYMALRSPGAVEMREALESYDYWIDNATTGSDRDALRQASDALADFVRRGIAPLPAPETKIHAEGEWTEEDGDVLWWTFPIEEPPYCGSPLCDDWPAYHTHWTRIAVPEESSWPK